MSKTKDAVIEQQNATKGFEDGKPVKIEAATRTEVAEQLKTLREQAAKDGFGAQGGFIEYDGYETFSAVITFNKL